MVGCSTVDRISIYWNVGDVLRKIMLHFDMSATAVAEQASIDARKVRDILRTGNYERDELHQIAQVWGLRAEDLTGQVPQEQLLESVSHKLTKAG